MNKSIVIIVGASLLLVGLYYYFNIDKNILQKSDLVTEQQLVDEEVVNNNFVWSTTVENLDQAPEGGSDFMPAVSLQLVAFGDMYQINDYIEESIYGCEYMQHYASENKIDSILIQYDAEYTDNFLQQFDSYHLCPAIAGGDLFAIKNNEGMYDVLHFSYVDGADPLTKIQPDVLFTVSDN